MAKAVLMGVAVVLLITLASAAFTVQAFSCNSQSGTIVVEIGGTLDCQASIKNTGTNSANISTVQLILDGTWAEQTTYTGLGFSSQVTGGATTTATFGNIRPTTPGLHGFNYVRIDSVTDNFPSSSTVNVLSIRNLVLTMPDDAMAGAHFTVSASTTAGGNEDINLEISPDCSLASGESSTKSLGSVSDNIASSASWRLVQGSSECSFDVVATGTSGSVTVTKTKADSVVYAEGGTTTTTTIIPIVNITLNEFMAVPPGAEPEWVEIFNAGNVIVNMAGWRLDDEAGASTPYVLPGDNISVGGYLVYYGNVTNIDLGDNRDSVRLLNTTLGLVDSYDWTTALASNTSMRRATDGGGSWLQSNSTYPPTPGATNGGPFITSLSLGWNLISIPLIV